MGGSQSQTTHQIVLQNARSAWFGVTRLHEQDGHDAMVETGLV